MIFASMLWFIFGLMSFRNIYVARSLGTLINLPTVRSRMNTMWLWTLGFGLAASYFTWTPR